MLQPGRYTELFFLDEATALAAGHRPCRECRRADYDRFVEIWSGLHRGEDRADAIDARLHEERVDAETRAHRLHESVFDGLPDGAFVLLDGRPCLALGGRVLPWTPGGYTTPEPRPARGLVITPPSLVSVLRAGWTPLVPFLHPSAGGPPTAA